MSKQSLTEAAKSGTLTKGGLVIQAMEFEDKEYAMFERENAFYEANRETLREKYLGKELVIVGDEIIGVYDDLDTAIDTTVRTRPLGTFCVKDVPLHPEDEDVWIPGFWVGHE